MSIRIFTKITNPAELPLKEMKLFDSFVVKGITANKLRNYLSRTKEKNLAWSALNVSKNGKPAGILVIRVE